MLEDAACGLASCTRGICEEMAETNWAISNSPIGETPLGLRKFDPFGEIPGIIWDRVEAVSRRISIWSMYRDEAG